MSDEQKSSAQARLQDMLRSQRDLESFFDALGVELDQATVESSKVQQQIRNLEQTSRTLERQQQGLAADLGID